MESIRAFFSPKSVAIVGATEKAGIGRVVCTNVISEPSFKGEVYPVNPTRKTVMGIPAFPSLDKCPTVPELVVIVTPAKTVPPIVGQCVDIGVKAVIIISSGFKEIGPEGQALEDQISEHLKRSKGKTRVVGPNCFGVMDTWSGLNATFAPQISTKGKSAMISQSGAMVCCILDWALQQGVGFASFASVGSMVDVNWGDLLEYYLHDENVRTIMIYMETIGNARGFIDAARRVSRKKPILLLKAGRTSAAAKAAVSHTGSLTGSDDVVDAALDRAGVIRVNTMSELFQLSEVVCNTAIPRGPNLAIVSHAGGPGVLASDAVAMGGGQLAEIPREVLERLDPQMPKHWSMSNPLDITGGALPDHYQKCLDEVGHLENVDGVLVFVGPLSMCPPTTVAANLKSFAQHHPDKTLVGVFLGGDDCQGARSLLRRSGVPVFVFTDEAAARFSTLWRYRHHLDELYRKVDPVLESARQVRHSIAEVDKIVNEVRETGRTVLSEAESKKILALCGVPISETIPAKTAEDAVAAAAKIGYPVVIKLHSETITHKSDVGGVILNVRDADAVKAAFETIQANIKRLYPEEWQKHFLGVSVQPMLEIEKGYEVLLGANSDPQFGPVVVFGTGGKLVEVYKDRTLILPPFTRSVARASMSQTKIYKALQGVRGQGPVNMEQLESLLVAFGDLAAYHPLIKEIDINPLFVSEGRICAIDARIVLWPKDTPLSKIPIPAIRPYPQQYVREVEGCVVRPLAPEDEDIWKEWRTRTANGERPQPTEEQRVNDLFTEFSQQLFFGAVCKETGKIALAVRMLRNSSNPIECFFDVLADPKADEKILKAVVTYVYSLLKEEGYSKAISHVCTHVHASIQPVLTELGMKEVGTQGEKHILESVF